MQHLQAKNEIEQIQRVYRKGLITYGEYVTKIGSIVQAFELFITRDDRELILENHEGYQDLTAFAQSVLN